MMSELIERVARAIYAARYDGPYQAVPWVEKAAHAAITAMRDPTDAMMMAGYRLVGDIHYLSLQAPGWGDQAGVIWRAMNDAALAEPPHPVAGSAG